MMNDFLGKTALITGASSGLGEGYALELAKRGANVILVARRTDRLRELSDRINAEYGVKASSVLPIDLSARDAATSLARMIKGRGMQIDILINNAGVLTHKPLAQTTLEDFQSVYAVNVFGPALLMGLWAPKMGKQGHVVNISSMGGIQGSAKFAGLAAYSSSKGALITLTELLAEEYKETGPHFNALALGAVDTEMLQQAFPGYQAQTTPDEMAAYVLQFALNSGSLLNGKVIQVSNSTP